MVTHGVNSIPPGEGRETQTQGKREGSTAVVGIMENINMLI